MAKKKKHKAQAPEKLDLSKRQIELLRKAMLTYLAREKAQLVDQMHKAKDCASDLRKTITKRGVLKDTFFDLQDWIRDIADTDIELTALEQQFNPAVSPFWKFLVTEVFADAEKDSSKA